jgi:hypothetical protein
LYDSSTVCGVGRKGQGKGAWQGWLVAGWAQGGESTLVKAKAKHASKQRAIGFSLDHFDENILGR